LDVVADEVYLVGRSRRLKQTSRTRYNSLRGCGLSKPLVLLHKDCEFRWLIEFSHLLSLSPGASRGNRATSDRAIQLLWESIRTILRQNCAQNTTAHKGLTFLAAHHLD